MEGNGALKCTDPTLKPTTSTFGNRKNTRKFNISNEKLALLALFYTRRARRHLTVEPSLLCLVHEIEIIFQIMQHLAKSSAGRSRLHSGKLQAARRVCLFTTPTLPTETGDTQTTSVDETRIEPSLQQRTLHHVNSPALYSSMNSCNTSSSNSSFGGIGYFLSLSSYMTTLISSGESSRSTFFNSSTKTSDL